jgi:hypothetical protein
MDNLQLTAMIIDIILFSTFVVLFFYLFYLTFANMYEAKKQSKKDRLDNELYEYSAE